MTHEPLHDGDGGGDGGLIPLGGEGDGEPITAGSLGLAWINNYREQIQRFFSNPIGFIITRAIPIVVGGAIGFATDVAGLFDSSIGAVAGSTASIGADLVASVAPIGLAVTDIVADLNTIVMDVGDAAGPFGVFISLAIWLVILYAVYYVVRGVLVGIVDEIPVIGILPDILRGGT